MAEKKEIKDALRPGTLLQSPEGVYKIRDVLGQGGFGITYLATSKVKVRNVMVDAFFAIKEHFISSMNERRGTTVIISNPNNTEDVQKSIEAFLGEAHRLNDLSGQNINIVNVNEVFEANNTAYYVMEYIGGKRLRDYVKEIDGGKLTELEALNIIKRVGNALQFLHDNRMTHLDVKPDNVMFRDDGEPLLIDFGLSKHYDEDGHPTSSIKVAGLSDGYAPMEQYVGINTFTPETDVYALAATLYYMLTGKHPQVASEMNAARIHAALDGVASPHVVRAVCSAMATLKHDRTHSVREFLRQLTTNDTTNTQVRVRGDSVTADNALSATTENTASATADSSSLSAAGAGSATVIIQPQPQKNDNHGSPVLHESSDNRRSNNHVSPGYHGSGYSGATTVIGMDNKQGSGNPGGGTGDGGSWLTGKIKYILAAAAVVAAVVVAVLFFGMGDEAEQQPSGSNTEVAKDTASTSVPMAPSSEGGSTATTTTTEPAKQNASQAASQQQAAPQTQKPATTAPAAAAPATQRDNRNTSTVQTPPQNTRGSRQTTTQTTQPSRQTSTQNNSQQKRRAVEDLFNGSDDGKSNSRKQQAVDNLFN